MHCSNSEAWIVEILIIHLKKKKKKDIYLLDSLWADATEGVICYPVVGAWIHELHKGNKWLGLVF